MSDESVGTGEGATFRKVQSCGHAMSYIASSGEGTSYCRACAEDAGLDVMSDEEAKASALLSAVTISERLDHLAHDAGVFKARLDDIEETVTGEHYSRLAKIEERLDALEKVTHERGGILQGIYGRLQALENPAEADPEPSEPERPEAIGWMVRTGGYWLTAEGLLSESAARALVNKLHLENWPQPSDARAYPIPDPRKPPTPDDRPVVRAWMPKDWQERLTDGVMATESQLRQQHRIPVEIREVKE